MAEEGKLVQVLRWSREDVEQRLGFRGGKYTDVNPWLTFSLAVLATLVFFAACLGIRQTHFAIVFLERGPTQHASVLLASWSLAILFLKWRKLLYQQRALALMVVPHSHDFVLAPANADEIRERMYGLVDNPHHFVLLSRIERALSNLRNIGVISDVSEILRSQAENDEAHMESSYALIRGFIWAIPVLGFIGTVLGLSQAIGSFGAVLAASEVIANLKDSLKSVTSGLATAFDTTLVALVAALIIQLLLTGLKKREEAFLDECKEYCHSHIISKLRLIQVQEDRSGSEGPTP